eukprot:1773430-Pleurochrysis_carterae.AAC.1
MRTSASDKIWIIVNGSAVHQCRIGMWQSGFKAVAVWTSAQRVRDCISHVMLALLAIGKRRNRLARKGQTSKESQFCSGVEDAHAASEVGHVI